MTFEEFFFKKKIDLTFFKLGEPAVFEEFVSHYEQMNEKSFDHTKKYWFNNLRIAYPLSEEKELQLKETFKPKIESSPVNEVSDAELENTPTNAIKPTNFKPRFKVPVSLENKESEIEQTQIDLNQTVSSEIKASSFKPRFKAGVVKAVIAIESELDTVTEVPSEEDKPTTAKPAGFKPRFKAGTTKAVEIKEENLEKTKDGDLNEDKPVVAKPAGFKPRFKTPKKDD